MLDALWAALTDEQRAALEHAPAQEPAVGWPDGVKAAREELAAAQATIARLLDGLRGLHTPGACASPLGSRGGTQWPAGGSWCASCLDVAVGRLRALAEDAPPHAALNAALRAERAKVLREAGAACPSCAIDVGEKRPCSHMKRLHRLADEAEKGTP